MTTQGSSGESATERFKRRKMAEKKKAVAVAVAGDSGSLVTPKPAEGPPERTTTKEKVTIATGPRRNILIAPSKILRTECARVEKIDDNIISLAYDMESFLMHPPAMPTRPIGLAAPQLGESVRVISCMLNPMSDENSDKGIITIINPQLKYEKNIHLVNETCLSLPGRQYKIKRGKIVKISGTLLDGTTKSFKGHDIVAQMFMHELNHLDGLLLDVVSRK